MPGSDFRCNWNELIIFAAMNNKHPVDYSWVTIYER